MGNSETKSFDHNTSYRIKERKCHSLLGDITIYEKMSNKKLFAAREYIFHNENDFKKKFVYFQQIKDEEGISAITKIEEIKKFEDNHLCSSVYKLAIYSEFYTRDLLTEVKIRRLQNRNFTEEQLSKYLFQLAVVFEHLQTNGIRHRKVRMNALTLDDSGKIKIIDPRLIDCKSYLELFLTDGIESGVYLSPECMESIRKRANKEDFDTFKSDCFSLGCLVLEAASFQSLDSAFDFESLIIHKDVIEERLNELKYSFSERFVGLLASMLEWNPKERIDFVILKGYFEPHLFDEHTQRITRSQRVLAQENKENSCYFNNLPKQSETFENEMRKVQTIDIQDHSLNHKASTIYKSHYLSSERGLEKSNVSFNCLYASTFTPQKQIYEDNSVYEGEIQQGKRVGKGKMSYPNGLIYEGDWKDNKKCGYGILYYDEKVLYEGEWQMDLFHGKGILYYENESSTPIQTFNLSFAIDDELLFLRYEGDFLEGKKHGMGTIYFLNGDKFTGRFSFDKASGNGTYFNSKGEMKIGKWNENKLVSFI